MTRKSPPPQIGTPPNSYDVTYMYSLVRWISAWIVGTTAPGDEVVSSLMFVGTAKSGAGLPVGAAWLDEATGVVRYVRASDVYAGTGIIKFTAGSVTV
jgi:hypothetical protein